MKSIHDLAEELAGGATELIPDFEAELINEVKFWLGAGKVCRECGERKPLSKFSMYPDGRPRQVCWVCQKRRQRERQRADT